MKSVLILALATLPILSGCASDKPSPAMREWARQHIAEKQRLEAEQTKHAQEVARLKAENERIKAQAEAEKKAADIARRQAEAAAWVVANKQSILAEFTKMLEPQKQEFLDNYGIQGKAVGFLMEDVELRGSALYMLSVIVWQNPDGTGGFIRTLSGLDLATNQTVQDEAIERKGLTKQELAQLFRNGDAKESTSVTSAKQPSDWAPTRETINAGYRAAIVAAGALIMNMIAGN